VAQKFNYSNKTDSKTELAPSANTSTEEKSETALEVLAEEVLDKALEAVEENPVKYWMETAAPFLKPGGKTVAVILALGFASIPLMVSGSPWVALVLAIGASVTAIGSCLG
jgi:predicted flavoprotein YhiN